MYIYMCVYILKTELETPNFLLSPNMYNTLSPKSFLLGYFRTFLTSPFYLDQNCSVMLLLDEWDAIYGA